jgi:uncharacterized protein (DUF2237 family)
MLLSFLFFAFVKGAFTNVKGEPLQHCSSKGMALTGFTRNGQCIESNDDAGSHHICIDLSSTAGGNFCSVTGQPDWCSSEMGCDGSSGSSCPVKHWCVCQWAFASYLQKAGGCSKIQEIVCEATNMEALKAYTAQAPKDKSIADALACLKQRCNITSQPTASIMNEDGNTARSEAASSRSTAVAVGGSAAAGVVVLGTVYALVYSRRSTQSNHLDLVGRLADGEDKYVAQL